MFGKSYKMPEILFVEHFATDGDQKLPKARLIVLLKILNMDKDLSKNSKWKLGNMGFISNIKPKPRNLNMVNSVRGIYKL